MQKNNPFAHADLGGALVIEPAIITAGQMQSIRHGGQLRLQAGDVRGALQQASGPSHARLLTTMHRGGTSIPGAAVEHLVGDADDVG